LLGSKLFYITEDSSPHLSRMKFDNNTWIWITVGWLSKPVRNIDITITDVNPNFLWQFDYEFICRLILGVRNGLKFKARSSTVLFKFIHRKF